MKKTIIAAAIALSASLAQAGVNVQYYVGYGLYPFGAADVTSGTPGTGLLAANGTGSAIIQLVYAGLDGIPDGDVTSLAATGDDVIWDSRVLSIVSGDSEWGNEDPTPLAFYEPNVYLR
jgi:hypothetical protein